MAVLGFLFGWMQVEISYKSLVTDFYPRNLVGQLAGKLLDPRPTEVKSAIQ